MNGKIATAAALVLGATAYSANAAAIITPSDTVTGIRVTVNGTPNYDNGVADITSNSIVANSTGNGAYQWTGAGPHDGTDGNNGTKALNFGNGDSARVGATKAVGIGFTVTPLIGPSDVTGFYFVTGNDSVNRDPVQIALQGTNSSDLTSGSSWTTIYNGATGLASVGGRNATGPEQDFTNTTAYTSYRLIFTAQKGVDNSIQYDEVQFVGTAAAIPEPASLGMIAVAAAGVLRRRRSTVAVG